MYFGKNAGMDFSSGTPVALTNSQMVALEACSTISDNNGNLLFYTNGVSVWNKNHSVMPNGSGLLGDPSTTQTIALLKPGSTNLYYIITLDQIAGSNGMRYSIVDMTLNGGLGDIISSSKNTLIRNNETERVAAIQRCDGNYWVLSHGWNSNTFYADLLDSTGFSSTVTSSVGTIQQNGSNSNNNENTVGQLVFSRQGDKVALAVRNLGLFEVFDFDVNTGMVSNPIAISSLSYNPAYGVAFSPDGSKLYGTKINPGTVYQFDLNAGSVALIAASVVTVGSFPNLAGSIFLAPDNKIYIPNKIGSLNGKPDLGVISNPNNLGTSCNFSATGFNLAGKESLLGAPNFPIYLNFQGPTVNLPFKTQTICQGDSINLTATTITPGYQVIWTGGGLNDTLQTVKVSPSDSTEYYVEVTNGSCSTFDTIRINVAKPSLDLLPDDTTSCQSIILKVSNSYSGVLWNGNKGGNSYTVDSTQKVYVSVLDPATGCTVYDTTMVYLGGDLPSSEKPQIEYDQPGCSGGSVQFHITNGNDRFTYSWDFGNGKQAKGYSPTGSYTKVGYYTIILTAQDTVCGGSITDTSYLDLEKIMPEAVIPNVFTPNGDNLNEVYKIFGTNCSGHDDFQIYNRWGNLIFETHQPFKEFWDGTFNGKTCLPGVYLYILRQPNGTKKGFLTLLQ